MCIQKNKMLLETCNSECKIHHDSGIQFNMPYTKGKPQVKVMVLVRKIMSTIIRHCHHACPQGMVPVLAQEIWKVFWNASVHVQVIWMQNDSWNESKTCKSDGIMESSYPLKKIFFFLFLIL